MKRVKMVSHSVRSGRSHGSGLQRVRIFILLLQILLGEEFGIAAQQNIGAAAGHVGGNRDGAFAAGLRDDERFALVILGVQNFMLHAHLLQSVRKPL